MSWARARHGTAGLTVPQARHGPSKLNRAVPGQESRHGVLARHGTRSRRAVPGHGGTVPCPGVPVPGRHDTPKWTCIPVCRVANAGGSRSDLARGDSTPKCGEFFEVPAPGPGALRPSRAPKSDSRVFLGPNLTSGLAWSIHSLFHTPPIDAYRSGRRVILNPSSKVVSFILLVC